MHLLPADVGSSSRHAPSPQSSAMRRRGTRPRPPSSSLALLPNHKLVMVLFPLKHIRRHHGAPLRPPVPTAAAHIFCKVCHAFTDRRRCHYPPHRPGSRSVHSPSFSLPMSNIRIQH
ncbi:hypothetical protein VPH35_013879 [Triticum aestivum]